MNKPELYQFLSDRRIQYKAFEHRAVFTVEEADALNLPDPDAGTKNIFLRGRKEQNYYLLTARGHLQVRIKDFQKKIGAQPLSFASEEDFRNRTISAHPNENTATVFLQANDLMKLLEENGNPVSWIRIDD